MNAARTARTTAVVIVCSLTAGAGAGPLTSVELALPQAPLPAGTTLDRAAWEGNLLHVDLTIPDSASSWCISDLDAEAISDAVAAPFRADSAFGGTVIRVRAGQDGPYRSLGDYIRQSTPSPQAPSGVDDVLPASPGAADGGLRGLGGPTHQGARQPVGALSGVTVFVSAGHGWTAGADDWVLQRPGDLEDMNEDHGNLDQLNYFVHYAFNAGATVVPFRPPGWQPIEIVLDNDNPAVSYTGTWGTNTTNAQYYGTNASDRYRFATADTNGLATARYTPTLTETDFYPVYAFVIASDNRTLQTYRIKHNGGISEVTVDHRMVGHGWVWLGEYYLEAGSDNYVEITSQSPVAGNIIADAIRWGCGMGDIPRTSQSIVSGYQRDEEASRYWAHGELGNHSTGFDSDIWDIVGSDDSSDNVRTAAKWSREMNQEVYNTDRWRRIYYEFHTNATGGGARGCIALITTLGATTYQTEYATFMANEIDADMLLLQNEFEYTWYDRSAATYTSAYGAICTPANGNEFDATIIELAFHDDPIDAKLLRDPRVRAAMAKSSVQGIVRFLNWMPGSTVPLTFAPDTPRNARVVDAGNGDVTLSWAAPLSDGARGDPATGYVIYQSTNGYGFGDPIVLGNVLTHTISGVPTGETRYYRIAATNAGGESMPSEVLAVRRPATGTATVLLVNGFDRLRRQQNYVQTFLFPPAYAGLTPERQIWRRSNSYDYMVQHAEAIAPTGYGFSSCSNEAVINGGVLLTAYDIVVWISGEESTEDDTFDATEQSLVTTYLDKGGALFVTGAEIGYDLDSQANGVTFYETKLKGNFVADDAGTYTVTGAAGGILSDIGAFDFDPANGAPYDADKPDQIAPQTGAVTAVSYVGGTGGTAGIQYAATCNRYRVVMFAFPFEAITSATVRADIVQRVITWLAGTTGPIVFDADKDCDVDLTDYRILALCMGYSGPNHPLTSGHICIKTYEMDYDGDLDIDMHEFAAFQDVYADMNP